MATFSASFIEKLRHWAGDRRYNAVSFLLSVVDYMQHVRLAHRYSTGELEKARTDILAALRRDGFYVWENFATPGEAAQLRGKIDALIDAHPECIHSHRTNDQRIFGVENLDDAFGPIAVSPDLTALASVYLNEPARVAFSLGARLGSYGEKLGSGGGWHRDSGLPQFKSMLYLSDVKEENGPFQLVARSHHFWRANIDNFLCGQTYGNVRYSEETIARILGRRKSDLLKTFTANAGTLILFDSSTLHRGMPIRGGVRYAVTNYFYPERLITDDLYSRFSPVAGFPAVPQA